MMCVRLKSGNLSSKFYINFVLESMNIKDLMLTVLTAHCKHYDIEHCDFEFFTNNEFIYKIIIKIRNLWDSIQKEAGIK